MPTFTTNDNLKIFYQDTDPDPGGNGKEVLIMIHGFTGTSLVFRKNIPALSKEYRVIAPDLRGHGESGRSKAGYHVSRLAMDLRELLAYLGFLEGGQKIRVIGGSLGCSILWCYAELFTTQPFTHMLLIDQSPLQNSDLNGWDSHFCNRGMNTPSSLAALQTTLSLSPTTAHRGTIAACLSYLSHPLPSDLHRVTEERRAADEEFFLGEAMKGDAWWYGKLMADHTTLDWRDSIISNFGPGSGCATKVFVVASSRSGCFPAEGPMWVVGAVNGDIDAKSDRGEGNLEETSGEKRATGVVIDWGGHWCYWEDPEKFNSLALSFLKE